MNALLFSLPVFLVISLATAAEESKVSTVSMGPGETLAYIDLAPEPTGTQSPAYAMVEVTCVLDCESEADRPASCDRSGAVARSFSDLTLGESTLWHKAPGKSFLITCGPNRSFGSLTPQTH